MIDGLERIGGNAQPHQAGISINRAGKDLYKCRLPRAIFA
jgi:hypothetical protein